MCLSDKVQSLDSLKASVPVLVRWRSRHFGAAEEKDTRTHPGLSAHRRVEKTYDDQNSLQGDAEGY